MKCSIKTFLLSLLVLSWGSIYAQNVTPSQTKQQSSEQVKKDHGGHCKHQGGCGHHCSHHQSGGATATTEPQSNGLDQNVLAVFAQARRIEKSATWCTVYDAKSSVMGYVVYSPSEHGDIKGYAGPTPLMIAFDKDKKIISVTLLPNNETPRFLQRIQQSGFMNSWNGLTVKSAREKKIDTVTGATFTSRSVIQTLQATLKRL